MRLRIDPSLAYFKPASPSPLPSPPGRGRADVLRTLFQAPDESHGCFPLTPTLSLGERENCRPSVGESIARRNFARRTLLLPLPGGEGRGEGKWINLPLLG